MSKYSIKAILRVDKQKADGTAPIYIQIIVPGEPPYRKPLGKALKPEHFDKLEGKVNKRYPGHSAMNKLIQHKIM